MVDCCTPRVEEPKRKACFQFNLMNRLFYLFLLPDGASSRRLSAIGTNMSWLPRDFPLPCRRRRIPLPAVLILLALWAAPSAAAGPVNGAEARRALQESFRATPEEIVELPLGRLGGHRKGKSGTGIVIVEFSDFGCGHCQAFNLVTYPKIEANLITPGLVLFISCNFFFETAENAKAVLAAGLRGKYWEMKARLFEEWGKLDRPVHCRIAQGLGLNADEFLADCASEAVARQAEAERRLGQDLGVKTTPTFLVGWQLPDGTFLGQRIRGPKPWTFFRDRIEQMRRPN